MHLGGGNANILDINLSHYISVAILSNETNFRNCTDTVIHTG